MGGGRRRGPGWMRRRRWRRRKRRRRGPEWRKRQLTIVGKDKLTLKLEIDWVYELQFMRWV